MHLKKKQQLINKSVNSPRSFFTILSIVLLGACQAVIGMPLISDPGFESGETSFRAIGGGASLRIDQTNLISEAKSLKINLTRQGNKVLFLKQFPWGKPAYSSSLSLTGKLKLVNIPTSTKIEITPVAYYKDNGERKTNPVVIKQTSSGVINLDQVLELDIKRPIDRVYYWVSLQGRGPVELLLDDVQLDIATAKDEASSVLNSDKTAVKPNKKVELSFISDPGFESGKMSFRSGGLGASLQIDETNVISETKSLRVNLTRQGNRVFFVKQFPWGKPAYGSSLSLKGKLKLVNIPTSTKIEITPVAYYKDNGERKTNPVVIKQTSGGVINLDQVLELDIKRPIDRVYYWVSLQGRGPIELLLDEVQLKLVTTDNEQNNDITSDKKVASALIVRSKRSLQQPLTPEISQDVVKLNIQNNLEENGSANNSFEHNIDIQLHPSTEVVGQGDQTVSFGLPVPPGVLVNTNRVAVFDENNQEVPAFVRSLGAWNNMPPQSLLCDGYKSSGNPGIRSILIQFKNEFITNDVQTFHIRLNQPRSLNIENQVDVKNTLRQVNDGTYSQHNFGYQILEPKIITVIEPGYLSCTNLTTLSGEANTSSDLVEIDKAQQDFFYTAINEFFDRPVDNKDKIDFIGDTARFWLYDRPQTFFNGYIRSGNVDNLREGLRAAEHYKHNIYTQKNCANHPKSLDRCVGFFKLKNKDVNSSWKDSKYSYNESLITSYLLTGNDSYLNYITLPTKAVKEVDFSNDIHTERHRANALLTSVMDYELTNNKKLLPYITHAIDQLYQRQQLALDGTAVNGCFNYTPEVNKENVASFSPWMSSLLSNALLRAYQAIGDQRIPGMLVDLAQCEVDRALFRTDVFRPKGYPNLLLPYYIAQSYRNKKDLGGENPWNSTEHALDVALPIALGAYFTSDLNQQSEFLDVTRELLHSHNYSIKYWTRHTEGRPIYRLSPPRKYSWQYKNVGPISWVLNKP